jgi:serine/threonine protein kinase
VVVADRYPRSFGRYSLLAPLAEGGMGALYLGCTGEPGLEKLCVIKTVLPQLADAEYVARFRDEAKVVVRLSHGNLVPVFDAGTVRGGGNRDELYLAMEHVDGKDLRAVWNRCAHKGIAFPVEVAAYIARELARGLYHAHAAGGIKLVHRDVSPPNILLSFAGEVRLTDFGLAASAIKKEKTAPGVIYGKVSYMSPEQARGEPLDGRTDLYAVGVILWELLTGRQLFPQAEENLIERVRAPSIDPPSKLTARVPADLEAIVLKALAPDRNERYTDCEALRVALAGWLAKNAPTIDNERIAAFLRQLFADEIDDERQKRRALLDALHADPGVGADPVAAAEAVARSVTRPGPVSMAQGRAADTRSLVGSHLDGKYQVRRLIGEGGMGLVYEAEHIEIGRRVAIKVLHPAYTRSPEVVARFRSEARAATRVGHPHIIDVFDSGTTVDGAIYLVMEYLDGRDLGHVIGDSAPMPVARAVAITREICEALAAAHKANILHRDLKPENIFLVDRPERPDFVKVLDFGIAKTIDSVTDRSLHQTTPGVAMGTPEYMAPEQAAGKDVDARADIYSVGAILYEMLCGNAPHEGDNVMEVLTKKATQQPSSLETLRPEIPQALVALVMRSLARDLAERPQSMQAFADELAQLVSGTPGESGIDRRMGDRRGERRVSARSSLVFAAVGAAALLLGWVLWPGRSRESRVEGRGSKGTESRPSTVDRRPSKTEDRSVVAPQSPTLAPPPPPAPRSPIANQPPINPRPSTLDPRLPPRPSTLDPRLPIQVAKRKLAEARQALQANQYSQAEDLYNQVRGMKLEMGAVTTGLAEVAFQRGRYAEAARIGHHATEIGGGVPARMVLGNALFKLGKLDEAIHEYQEVLKIDHHNPEAKSNLKAALSRRDG